MIRIAFFATCTAVGAFIALPLPFTPVPFTLQLFFTILSPLVIGPRSGALSQAVYLALGAVGVPVFAGGVGGLGVLLGPTGGFLVGFVPGAYVMGKLNTVLDGRASPWVRGLLVGIGGFGVIYGMGSLWLAKVLDISLSKALVLGCVPYIVPDSIKCFLAITAAGTLRRRVFRISHIPLG